MLHSPPVGILGVPRDIGSQFEITVRVVDANGNRDLERWVRDSENAGRYPGITMSESVFGAVSHFERHYRFWLPRDTGNSYTRSAVLARSLFRPCLESEPDRPARARQRPLPHAVGPPARAGVRRLRWRQVARRRHWRSPTDSRCRPDRRARRRAPGGASRAS
jgi:hypothetical protein